MKDTTNARHDSSNNCPEWKPTEEQFLEQFATLEESLTLLQAHIHSMSENVERFGSLARHIRRSTCPTADHHEIGCRHTHFSNKAQN